MGKDMTPSVALHLQVQVQVVPFAKTRVGIYSQSLNIKINKK